MDTLLGLGLKVSQMENRHFLGGGGGGGPYDEHGSELRNLFCSGSWPQTKLYGSPRTPLNQFMHAFEPVYAWPWNFITRLPPAAADPRRIKGKVIRTGPETRPQTQGPLIRSSSPTKQGITLGTPPNWDQQGITLNTSPTKQGLAGDHPGHFPHQTGISRGSTTTNKD